MATHTFETHTATQGSGASEQTRADRMQFDRDLTVMALSLGFGTGGSATAAPRIYDAAGNLIGSGPAAALSSGGGSIMSTALPLTRPVILRAWTLYYIGFYLAGAWSGVGIGPGGVTGHVHASNTPGWNLTWQIHRYANGDAWPNVDSSAVELWQRIHFDPANIARRGFNAPIIGRGRRAVFTP